MFGNLSAIGWRRWFVGTCLASLFCVIAWTYWTQQWPAETLSKNTIVHASKTAHLDGVYYYAYLRSLLIDGDLDFSNDYVLLGNPLRARIVEQTKRFENVFTIGPALFWWPFFLISRVLSAFDRAWGPPDGSGERFQMLVFFGSCVYGFASSVIGYLIARVAYLRRDALIASVTAMFATPLYWHMVRQASYSHAISAFVTATLVLLWIRQFGSMRRARWFVLGLVSGLGMCVRVSAAVHTLVPAAELAPALYASAVGRDAAAARRQLASGFSFAAGMTLGFLPQMLAWKSIYGTYLTVPQGSGFILWSASRYGAVLFSSWNGWAAWHPLVTCGVLGLLVASIREGLPPSMRRLARAALLVIAAEVYLNGATDDWFGGWAFGGRRFTDCTVYIAIGVTQLFALLGARELHVALSRLARLGLPIAASLVFVYFSVFLGEQHLSLAIPLWGPVDLASSWRAALTAAFDRAYLLTGNWGSIPANWWYASAGNVSPALYDVADSRDGPRPLLPGPKVLPFVEPYVGLGGFGNRATYSGVPCRWLSGGEGRFSFVVRQQETTRASVSLASFLVGTRIRLSIDGQGLLETPVEPGGLRVFDFVIPAHLLRAGNNIVRVEQSFPPPVAHALGGTGRMVAHDITVRSITRVNEIPGKAVVTVDGRTLLGAPRGISLFAFDSSGSIHLVGAFDTIGSRTATRDFVSAVRALPPGTVVAVAVTDDAGSKFSPQENEAIGSLGGSASLLNSLRGSYALLGVKGAPIGSGIEAFSRTGSSTVTLGRSAARGTLWHQLVLEEPRR